MQTATIDDVLTVNYKRGHAPIINLPDEIDEAKLLIKVVVSHRNEDKLKKRKSLLNYLENMKSDPLKFEEDPLQYQRIIRNER